MKPLLLHRPGGDLVVVTRPFVTGNDTDSEAKTRLWFAMDDYIDVAETVEQIASALGAVAVGGSA